MEKTRQQDPERYNADIRQYFGEYFANRGIDLYNEPKRANTTMCQAAWLYVYDHLFKPPGGYRYVKGIRTASNLDLRDSETLAAIAVQYNLLCFEFDFKTGVYGFCSLIGINRDTFYSWMAEETRAERTPKHSDICKCVKGGYTQMLRDTLGASPIGVITLANNDNEAGLNYNRQNLAESALLSVRSVNQIAQDIAAPEMIEAVDITPDF